jgi:zinc protease
MPLVEVAYHGPAALNQDYMPMKVLDYILLRGESSRLYRRLVDEDQVATSVSGGHSAHLDPFPFKLMIQPRSEVQPDKIEQILYQELERVRTNLVSEMELQKAKNTAVADFYRSMKTISGKADLLGTYEVIFGDYHELFKTVDRINSVTREDLRRVAMKYFSPKNRTVAFLVPEDDDNATDDEQSRRAHDETPSTH